MTEYLRNRLHFILTGFAVLILLATFLALNTLKDNGNIYITKLQGDESVLEDLEVKGTLYDRYAGIEFGLKGGKVNQRLDYFNDDRDFWKYVTIAGENVLWAGNNEYLANLYPRGVDNQGASVNIRKQVTGKKVSHYKEIKTDMTTTSPKAGFGNVRNAMDSMAEVDGKLYFVIPTDEAFRGNSGIYEIASWSSGSSTTGYTKLADIDLEDGNVQVKGMFAVDNKLCVVTVQDNKTIIRYFDLEAKEFSKPLEIEHEVVYQDIPHPDIEGAYSYDNYFIFSVSTGSESLRVYTIDVSEDLSLVSTIDVKLSKSEVRLKTNIIYKNDMLYVASLVVEHNSPDDEATIVIGPKYHMDLVVYDNIGQLKFSGKLESDINDDVIWQQNKYRSEYSPTDYESRLYGKLHLR